MRKTIEVFKDVPKLSQFLGQMIEAQTQLISAGRFYTVALSGGSTPKAVLAYLAEHFKDSIDWKKVKVFWSDERCVPPESAESNYRMAKESLLDHVAIPADQIFRVQGEADPASEAERYAGVVRQHVHVHSEIPAFDLLMLGLGDDGHTASIFPGHLDLFRSERLICVAEHPETGQKRITVTGETINEAHQVVFLVTGAAKAEKVATVVEHKEGWEQLPAAHVQPENGTLIWLLDEAAAAQLRVSIN